jgi:glycosidase
VVSTRPPAPPGSPGAITTSGATPDKYKGTRIIFKDTEPSNWTWDPWRRPYYWHRFFSHQPDLNFDNPAVHDEMIKVVDFWLDLGVDGLRLDAVPYLYEREGTSCENLPETHAFLKKLRAHVDEKYGDRMLLAEANQWPEDAAYFGRARRRMPHGVSFSAHAAIVHVAAHGGPPAHRGHFGADAADSRNRANGRCSCATTTS